MENAVQAKAILLMPITMVCENENRSGFSMTSIMILFASIRKKIKSDPKDAREDEITLFTFCSSLVSIFHHFLRSCVF